MANPTSMQMFQHDVQDELVAGFMSYSEPEPDDHDMKEDEPPEDEDKGTSTGDNN